MELGRFSSLIEALYDAALDPSGWARLALMVAQAFAAESCAVQGLDLAKDAVTLLGQTANFDTKAVETYQDYYHKTDILALRMAKLGTGRVMLSAEVTGEVELLDSEIFNDYGRRLGIFWALGSVISVAENTFGAIGIHRPHGAPNFDADDKRCLDLLLPHLSRAMQLRHRLGGLARDRQIAVEALESLGAGVIAVDADATLLFANGMAERLLRTGLELTVRRGRLHATDQSRADELHYLIKQAAMATLGHWSSAGGVVTLPRLRGRPLSLLVCPLRPDTLTTGPSTSIALLFFGDPDATLSTPHQPLVDLHGLTPAEARLMAALVDGERMEHYADRRGISINTVKAQSKQVFAKTGHGRQADLIREVLADPALRAISIKRR